MLYLIWDFYGCLFRISPVGVSVLAIVAYPIGITSEQLALYTKLIVLKQILRLKWLARLKSVAEQHSEENLIIKYVTPVYEDFWGYYMRIHAKGGSDLVAIIERYNLTRFFFLNMAFLSLLCSVIHSFRVRITDSYSLIMFVAFVIWLIFHIQTNQGFYRIVGIASVILKETKGSA